MSEDLVSTYLGLSLRSPIVASASPLTGALPTLRRIAAAGAGAVVLPSLFEEQVVAESLGVHRTLMAYADATGEADGYFPPLQDYNTGPERYLRLVAEARRELSVPVIASLNGTSPGGWTRYAALVEEAGAHALELNVYAVAADAEVSGREVEQRAVDLVAAVRAATSLPLAVKISPFFSSLPHVARRLVEAGADGLVLFNRFYQPDFDLDALEVVPRIALSDSEDLRLPLRWTAILSGRVSASLAVTSGVHTSEDVVKALLAGADAVMTTSALLQRGPEHIALLEEGLRWWLAEHGYVSVSQLRGSMSQRNVADPARFERATYVASLSSFPRTVSG